MTTDTEALRAKFEAWATAAYRLSFDDDTPLKRYLWAAYQAGHAAAKAETAAAVAQERERCIGIIESHHIPVGNSAAGEMACEWTYDALKTIRDAIRAVANEAKG